MFYEKEELKRTIKELGLKMKYAELEKRFDDAKVVELPKAIWKVLDNTDHVEVEEDAKARLKEYGREEGNYEKILKEFNSGIFHPALIIMLKDGTYYLVAGNTRLMVAMVNKIKPKVKIISGIE